MKLTKKEKTEKAKHLAQVLEKAPHLFFTQYQGLKFVEMDELRGQLRPLGGRYSVVKNSQVRYALKEAGVEGVDPKLLKGPVGLLVADNDDPVAAAKVLAAFAKKFPALKIKAGYIEKKWMPATECQRLSTLGTKPELLGKLVGVLYANAQQAAAVLAAPIRDFVLALQALESKKKSEPIQGQAAA